MIGAAYAALYCVTQGSRRSIHSDCMGILDPHIVLIFLIPALHIEVLHMQHIRPRKCNHNVWIFMIPAFYIKVLH